MWLYTVMLVLPPILLAIWIWWNRRKGEVQVRWWAWPVLLASIPLSLPAHLTLAIGGAVTWIESPAHLPAYVDVHEATRLAPWLSNVLCYCLWLQLFTWVLGLFIVLRWKGVVFARPKAKRFFLGSVGAVMVPLCLFDALFLALMTCFTLSCSWSEVAEAASPDGRLLARAYEEPSTPGGSGDWATTYEIVFESNGRFPLLAKSIAPVNDYKGRNRLVWSRDSQVVAFWCKEVPAAAHDFSHRITLMSPIGWNQHVQVNKGESEDGARKRLAAEFTQRIDRLMAEHGGPAP